jgi:hypothetical protein
MQFSHTFDLDHVFKEFIRHIYVLTVYFILVTGHEHALHLRHHIVFYFYQQKTHTHTHTKGKSLSLLEFKASDSACNLVTTLTELPKFRSGLGKFYSPF